ncbi:MlaC/ttg2D family ABC transporter substrate-binding protein [Thalassotalea marina]|uniref:Organic solvent ABC transporter substrate-binding protein n=1 Tax=Thalassotalea marina TaxID=1673741 RepID=A0A919BP95_9GAMM|nr:ABC transporter substrate-binding protein [Thalassotalea marina]GHG03144.1 organic solvent ABC transporter substrate-binding protein [Thalassotalea marina]
MKTLALVFAALISFSALANQAPSLPDQVIQQTGERLFSRIAASQQELTKFPELMREIVEQELMPAIDYQYASYKILGKHLRKISQEQRTKFVDSMRHYLIRTYATALQQYKNQQVSYGKVNVAPTDKMVSVDALITESGKPDIHLTFQMRKNKKTGEWKAYDLIVEGISLLSSKQAEFNSRINKLGIDQVTLELTALTR